MGVVKNRCDQSGDGTQKLIVSEEWADRTNDILHVDTDSQKIKTDQMFLGGHGRKWLCQIW